MYPGKESWQPTRDHSEYNHRLLLGNIFFIIHKFAGSCNFISSSFILMGYLHKENYLVQ